MIWSYIFRDNSPKSKQWRETDSRHPMFRYNYRHPMFRYDRNVKVRTLKVKRECKSLPAIWPYPNISGYAWDKAPIIFLSFKELFPARVSWSHTHMELHLKFSSSSSLTALASFLGESTSLGRDRFAVLACSTSQADMGQARGMQQAAGVWLRYWFVQNEHISCLVDCTRINNI